MAFFKRHQGRGSYDLFSTYNYFMPGVSDLAWLVILFFVGVFLGILISAGLALGISQDFALTYGMVIVYPVQFIPAMLYASAVSNRNMGFEPEYPLDNSNFGGRSGLSMALIVSVMALAAAFVIEPVSMLLPEMSEATKLAMEQMLKGPVWIVLLSVSVFAPFFEEWLCRGIILRGLLKKMKPGWAIVISALVFGLIHMNLWQAIPAFIIGTILGYVYYKTGSLKLTMLMHCVNNTFALLISRIPALADAETFMDILCPWKYTCIYIASVLFLLSTIVILAGIPKKEGARSGCDEIPPLEI